MLLKKVRKKRVTHGTWDFFPANKWSLGMVVATKTKLYDSTRLSLQSFIKVPEQCKILSKTLI